MVLAMFATEREVRANTDPGTGALIWQMLVAGLIGAGFYFRRITSWFKNQEGSKELNEPAPPTQPITTSFRDPAGSLFRYQGRVLRVVNAIGAVDLEAFLASQPGRKPMAAGAVVPTRALDVAECRELKRA
jgi:hypothetical protein